MSQENPGLDVFDIVDFGGTDERRYMVVAYRGRTHQIVEEKMWRLLGMERSEEGVDYWFMNAVPVSAAFGKEHSIYMLSALAALSCVLRDNQAELPVMGVDIGKINEIAGTPGHMSRHNYESYFKSLIEQSSAA